MTPASHALQRRLVFEGRLGEIGVLSWQVMWHAVRVARLVLLRLAWVRRQLQGWGPDIGGTANERLCQVVRIDDRERPLQVRFVQRHVFDDGGAEAGRHAVAANETLFEVSRRDLQGVSSEPSGREAIPGTERVWRGPLAAVEPDHPVAGSLLIRHAVRHELTAHRIDDLVDPHGVQSLWLIGRAPWSALQESRCRIRFLVVGVRPHARRIVQRKTAVVARIRTRIAIALILVRNPAPCAGQVDGRVLLGQRRPGGQ